TPLPRGQLFLICAARFAEPVALTVLFPFMYFVRDFKVTDDPNQTAYYVGILASVFAVSQFISGIPWGWLSDRIGRRPVVLLGLTTTTICTLLFGFSKSYAWAITLRVLAGLGNGNVAVLKSMVAEISDQTNQARAFSFIPMTYVLGSIVGPLIGGLLADPAQHYPDTFGRIALFRQFPYLLPCLVCSGITFCSLLLSLLCLEETLVCAQPERTFSRTTSDNERRPLLQSSASAVRVQDDEDDAIRESSAAAHSPAPRYFLIPNACWPSVLFYALLSFQSIICDELTPLWTATPVARGGLDFDSKRIGTLLSICALVTLAVQLTLFAPLQFRLGSLRLFQLSMLLAVPVYVLLPYSNLLAQPGDGHTVAWLWAAVLAGVGARLGLGVLSFTSVNLIVLDTARQSGALGVTNAVAQCMTYLMRSIGPTIGGALWSWSLA
ncbi:major facilitator superfamily domain-containing protein, partial [Thamnocephalis sphaerospora]